MIVTTLRDKRPPYSTVKNWAAKFTTGHLSTEDEERSGRQTQEKVPENVDAIHSTILDNQRISTKKIAESLAVSQGRLCYVIHKIVHMRKLSAKWVPKCLDAIAPCGGGLEYLHRIPASRKRRQKGTQPQMRQ
jgi:hypothetical protein